MSVVYIKTYQQVPSIVGIEATKDLIASLEYLPIRILIDKQRANYHINY